MEEKAGLKKEEEDDDDDEDGKNSKIEGEELQVRDVQYKLETLFLNDPKSSLSLVVKSHQPVKVMPLVSPLPWSIAHRRCLRKDLGMKERGLRIRPLTWVFDPVPGPTGVIQQRGVSYWQWGLPNINSIQYRFIVYIQFLIEGKRNNFNSMHCYDFLSSITVCNHCLCGYHSNSKDSIYGKRDGTIQGLAMVRKGARSLFHNTKGWKQGCVHGVKMVSRQDMFKPDPWIYWCILRGHSRN